MRVPEIADFLVELYFAGRPPVLILGPPGIGKSESVRDAARAVAGRLGLEYVEFSEAAFREGGWDRRCVLVDLRLTELEPADILGVPRVLGDSATSYVPPLWARALAEARCGFLFLDELTNVQRDDVAAVAYKLILERMSGFTRFPDGVMVVAAGNDPESSPIARPLPAPLINRLLVVRAEPPDPDEWYAYMASRYGDSFDRRTYLYLSMNREDMLERPQQLETTHNFATPRTWTMLALVMGSGMYREELVDGLLGPAVGPKFRAFLSLKVDVGSILEDPTRFDGLSLDAKLVAIHEVARMYMAGERAGDVERLARHLAGRPEWLVLLVRYLRPEHASRLLSAMPEDALHRLYKVASVVRHVRG